MLHQPTRTLRDEPATKYTVVWYGSFTLPETDSGTDFDLDTEPRGYTALCSYFYFCIGQESESVPLSEPVSGNVDEPLTK